VRIDESRPRPVQSSLRDGAAEPRKKHARSVRSQARAFFHAFYATGVGRSTYTGPEGPAYLQFAATRRKIRGILEETSGSPPSEGDLGNDKVSTRGILEEFGVVFPNLGTK
ncbi:MAG TPA: hypothetical protein VEZ90_10140, partial [Blastocatellia bacterium]|nr:hypothetical protein [Blastocatellia bacterium]